MKKHTNDKRQINIPTVGFELSNPGSEQFQIHNLDHVINGIGTDKKILELIL